MEKLNQIEAAKRGIVTEEMIAVAKFERREPEWIRERVANGRIVGHARDNCRIGSQCNRPTKYQTNLDCRRMHHFDHFLKLSR